MAFTDTTWYVNYGDGATTGYYALTAWATGATIAAGALRRQSTTPSVGNERVFVAIVAGTTHATTEPTWTVTRGAKNTDNTVTWQECTGASATNGDVTNTPTWTTVKNTAVTLGQIIKNNAATHYFICSTAGTAGNGSEPTWGTTAGNTTTDNTITWTCIGAVGSFSAFGAPHNRIVNALATNWGAANNTFYVADNHAETQSTNMDIGSSAAASGSQLISILCCDKTKSPPTSGSDLRTTATISTTGNTAISLSRYAYYYGITFNNGSGANSPTSNIATNTLAGIFLDSCAWRMTATGSGGSIQIGSTSSTSKIRLRNTPMGFGNAGQTVQLNMARFEWLDTASAVADTVPTTLFNKTNGNEGEAIIRGVDLSALGSGKTLVGAHTNINPRFLFANCKLGSSVTKSATPSMPGAYVDFVRCDSAATNYIQERYWYEGTLSTETTIVRTGGASDGTTTIAWKIITTANANKRNPFECFPISIWNEMTGSAITVTVEGIWGGGAVPNNDEIWMDVEYPGSSSFPISSFATTSPGDPLTAGTGVTSSSQTWGGSTTKFKFTKSITPQMKGPIVATIKAAKASSTFYIDPLIVVT